MFGFSTDYNYDQFTKSMLMKDMVASRAFGSGPKPGERAADFELRNMEGDSIRLRHFRGEKNVVLTFGSATCPMTAGSIHGINELVEEYSGRDVEFLFIYVREAHPGEALPVHRSMADKTHAAEALRDEEHLTMPVLVDDLRGSVHRRYGSMPNSTYIIDRSGRVAFRSLWTQPSVIKEALDQLLRVEEKRGVDHAVVLGGEDRSMPVSYPALFSYRALQRGGRKSILDFERAMGLPGKMVVASSRIMGPIAENPGKTLAGAALGAGVLVAGLYAGRALRRRRLTPSMRTPYESYPAPKKNETEREDEYGAVGI